MDGSNGRLPESGLQQPRFQSRAPAPRRSRRSRWWPFFLFVLVPTIASATYLFAYAADQYVSDARFLVRGAAGSQPSLLSGLLQGVGVARAQDDTFAIQEYILSRDALAELNRSVDVRAVFARPEADLLSQFPWPYFGATFEHLYKHYLSKVDVSYDSTTGVTSLQVRTFRAEDSALIATTLLEGGERLVNAMNERQLANTMKDARREVSEAETRVQKVAADLAAYRNRAAMLDPNRQSVSLLQGITEMQARMTVANTQLGELLTTSPQSPLIDSLRRRVKVLQDQIEEAQGRIAGSSTSMVPQITEYDALTLQREFADRQLSSAISFLDTARLNAERQQIYLDQIVRPNTADYPLYPKRLVDILIVFVTCFCVYTFARLLIAGAREHRTL